MVRDGKVLSAPHFSTKSGPGSPVDDDLAEAVVGVRPGPALTGAFGIPTKVANDADIQGAAVVRGTGLELVITLGTGFGTGLFYEGKLMPHLEIAHQPFRKGETYNDQLGEATRKEIGEERWNKRVHKAIVNLRALCSSTTSTSGAATPGGWTVTTWPTTSPSSTTPPASSAGSSCGSPTTWG